MENTYIDIYMTCAGERCVNYFNKCNRKRTTVSEAINISKITNVSKIMDFVRLLYQYYCSGAAFFISLLDVVST